MTTQPPSILRLDRRALKVLAHPLRSRLLTALRMHGPATATALAETLETNTGATSYHLRKLASVGLVEETEGGRGRERPWRAATEMHGWTERDVEGDPDAQAATDWLRRHYNHLFMERYQAWLDAQGSWPIEWQDAAGASDYALRLSPARLLAFEAEFQELFERYRETRSDAADDPEAEVVQVYLYVFPLDPSPR
jgi:DNA-binding transcriptional ArsR family regulator